MISKSVGIYRGFLLAPYLAHLYEHSFTIADLTHPKPLWANNAHKVEPTTRPIKNLSKSLLILKSSKTNLKLPFLIAQSFPIFSILQYCRAIGGCYWTYIAKKNENV